MYGPFDGIPAAFGTCSRDGPGFRGGRLRLLEACADADPAARGAYQIGETELGNRRYDEARPEFPEDRRAGTRTRPTRRGARFLVGERSTGGEFDKAVREFEAFWRSFPSQTPIS